MNIDAGAIVRLGRTGITIYGDRYRGPGELYFRDFNWNDMPSMKSDDVQRPMSDGDYPSASYLEPRDLEMGGFLVAASHELMLHMVNRLKAQRGRTVRLAVDEPSLTTWADTEVRSVRVQPFGFAPEAEFTIVFHMPDPRKYGPPAKVFASGEPVSHRGNYDATPEVTVTGNMPSGYRITGPAGRQYVVSQALAPGQEHRIDFSTGWLYRDGVLQQGAVTRPEAWTIPPGSTVSMTLVPVAGSGALAVRVPYTAI